jgi:hypothetical protein
MKKLFEGFQTNDLVGVLENKIHIDEFAPKMGKDEDVVVLSFLVNDKQASIDLIDFLERGYDFLLDCDLSASEIRPGSYLVFVELLRRRRLIEQIFTLLSDLSAASQLNINDWKFRYMNEDKYYPVTAEEMKIHIPLYPRAYKERFNKPIEGLKQAAGLKTENYYYADNAIEHLQHNAGIYNVNKNNNL